MKRLISISVLISILFLTLVNANLQIQCSENHPQGENLKAYWKFDNNRENSIGSYSIVSASTNNDYTELDKGQVGQAAKFNGNQRITIQNADNLRIGSSPFTIQFWVKPDETFFDSPVDLINKGNYKISLQGDPMDMTITATVGTTSISHTFTPEPNRHDFIALTVGPVGPLKLYVNGAFVNNSTGGFTGLSSIDNLVIGEGFIGSIDELAIFKGSANSEDILGADYFKGLAKNHYCDTQGEGYSGTDTHFAIDGCTQDGFNLPVGRCSADGRYYCHNVSATQFQLLRTTTVGSENAVQYACSEMNNDPIDRANYNPCCPYGHFCNSTGYCQQHTQNCNDYNTSEACEANFCYWMGNTCVHNPSDFSCSYYRTEEACLTDRWRLGTKGTGTHVCGTYVVDQGMKIDYSIPYNSCRCVWTSTTSQIGNNCVLAWDTHPDIFGESGKDAFTCYKNYTTGLCDDTGRQIVNWTAILKNQEGIFNTPPVLNYAALVNPQYTQENITIMQKLLNLTGCTDGSVERSCGDAIIKLPGFSLTSTILSSLTISLIYFLFKRKEE